MSSTPDIIAKLAPSLDPEELEGIAGLSVAIIHAIQCVERMPSTLDPRCRALIVTKLEEADHWCIELTRIAARA